MDYRRYLKHYGVLGMHWGIRKEEKHTPRKGSRTSTEEEQVKKKNKKQGLSDRQKLLLKIGVAAAATGLAAYGGYKLYKLYKIDASALSTPLVPKVDPIIAKLKTINPLFNDNINDKNYLGSHLNCASCTIAQELVMRGEKVHARLNEEGMMRSQLGEFFNLKPDAWSDLFLDDDTEKLPISRERGAEILTAMKTHILKTYPKGSRGAVGITWSGGSHLMSFLRNDDGVRIDNPQDPTINIAASLGDVLTRGDNPIQFIRLDNAEINRENISKVVTNDLSDVRSDFTSAIAKGQNFVMQMRTPEETTALKERLAKVAKGG